MKLLLLLLTVPILVVIPIEIIDVLILCKILEFTTDGFLFGHMKFLYDIYPVNYEDN